VSDRPVFYYELQSPYSWLAAERINQVLPLPPVWKPVSYGHIVAHTGVLPWSFNEDRGDDFQEIERRAKERKLQDVYYPPDWPKFSTIKALRAATFAMEIGKGVAFSLAAFRQQFNAGRRLDDVDTILLAGAACELHPDAILKNIERDSIKQRLTDATNEAIERGVTGVPTVAIGDQLFHGDDRLEDAAAALNGAEGP
jgi:2-hydroxychromene-2-carboxylate isomerase